MSIQKQLIDMYLERFNNYLTDRKFAEDYGLHIDHAVMILRMGKELQEENVDFFKNNGFLLYK